MTDGNFSAPPTIDACIHKICIIRVGRSPQGLDIHGIIASRPNFCKQRNATLLACVYVEIEAIPFIRTFHELPI
jgi:hypothetical protein